MLVAFVAPKKYSSSRMSDSKKKKKKGGGGEKKKDVVVCYQVINAFLFKPHHICEIGNGFNGG